MHINQGIPAPVANCLEEENKTNAQEEIPMLIMVQRKNSFSCGDEK